MIALIAAYDKNKVIGRNGKIPWKIKGEQKRFKALTTNNVVVMGRRSFEEIGKPLPNRITIVVSNTQNYIGENCYTVKSLKEALTLAGKRDVFISGGTELYKEAIPIVEKMYITEIDGIYEGDKYFPEFNMEKFDKKIENVYLGEVTYSYVTYSRKL